MFAVATRSSLLRGRGGGLAATRLDGRQQYQNAADHQPYADRQQNVHASLGQPNQAKAGVLLQVVDLHDDRDRHQPQSQHGSSPASPVELRLRGRGPVDGREGRQANNEHHDPHRELNCIDHVHVECLLSLLVRGNTHMYYYTLFLIINQSYPPMALIKNK